MASIRLAGNIFELTPLSDDESDALIDALQPAATDAQRTAVRIRCDGVPFYIEHVVAGLDDIANDEQVPEALYAPLFARLHARTDVLPVLEAAAVIGRSGDVGLLRTVVESAESGTDVDSVVAELVSAGVFESTGNDHWRFRHELFREVAAELAPPSRHRELHAWAATALVEAAADTQPDWRLVAAHYEQAQRFDEAVDAYRKASVDARRRGAAREALTCLTNALLQLEGCDGGAGAGSSREIAIRLERGFLSGALQGSMSGEGPGRPRAVPGTGEQRWTRPRAVHHDDRPARATTFPGPNCAGRRRPAGLAVHRSPAIDRGCYPVIAYSWGTVSWLRGDFDSARGHFLQALADRSAADPDELDTRVVGGLRPDRHLAQLSGVDHMMSGDLDRRQGRVGRSGVVAPRAWAIPQNAFNRAHDVLQRDLGAPGGRQDRGGDRPGRRSAAAHRGVGPRHVAIRRRHRARHRQGGRPH